MGQTVRAQVLSLTLLLASVVGFTAALKIGAFNVKIFGVKKMENQDVVNILIKVIIRHFSCVQKLFNSLYHYIILYLIRTNI